MEFKLVGNTHILPILRKLIKSVPVVILIETNEILNYTYVLVKKQETDFKLIKFDRADINLK